MYTDEFAPLQPTSRAASYRGRGQRAQGYLPRPVMQASGAAAEAAQSVLARAGGSLTARQRVSARDRHLRRPTAVGVFVCHCGTSTSPARVDVAKVCDYARTLPCGCHAERNLFTCSPDTQEAMKETIRKQGIEPCDRGLLLPAHP